MKSSFVLNKLIFGVKQMSILEQYITKKIKLFTQKKSIELYTKGHDLDSNRKLYFNSFLSKWLPILYIQVCPFKLCFFKKCVHSNMVLEKVMFEEGKLIRYVTKTAHLTDEYNLLANESQLMFIGQKNYTYLLKTLKTNFKITAKELCMITNNPFDTNVFVINSSFDEMIFKDTDIIMN